MRLAELCSKAVDFAKNGVPVDINDRLPKLLIKFKPDWDKKEVTGARELEYYESDKALGFMFRTINLRDQDEPIDGFPTTSPDLIPPLQDPISCAVSPLVQRTLNTNIAAAATTTPTDTDPEPAAAEIPQPEIPQPEALHAQYVREMRYICVTHTLVDAPDVRLKEEEVVLGTILATTTQPRWRADRAQRMRVHSRALVRDIRAQMNRKANEDEPTKEEQRAGLLTAWDMWCWAQHHRDKEFIEGFSLIALGVVLDCLKRLGAFKDLEKKSKDEDCGGPPKPKDPPPAGRALGVKSAPLETESVSETENSPTFERAPRTKTKKPPRTRGRRRPQGAILT